MLFNRKRLFCVEHPKAYSKSLLLDCDVSSPSRFGAVTQIGLYNQGSLNGGPWFGPGPSGSPVQTMAGSGLALLGVLSCIFCPDATVILTAGQRAGGAADMDRERESFQVYKR